MTESQFNQILEQINQLDLAYKLGDIPNPEQKLKIQKKLINLLYLINQYD